MNIRLPLSDGLAGIMPALDAEKLPIQAAQQASDVNLAGNTLAPFRGRSVVEALGDTEQKVLYKYHQTRYRLTCDAAGTPLSVFQAVTNGSFAIGDQTWIIEGLDFSGASSYDDCAAIIQTEMRRYDGPYMVGATCVYDTDRFIFEHNAPLPYLIESEGGDSTDISSIGTNGGDFWAGQGNEYDGNINTTTTTGAAGGGPHDVPGSGRYSQKDYYAANATLLTNVVFKANDIGFYFNDPTGVNIEPAPGTVTCTVYGSHNASTWVSLGSGTITNADGATIGIPITTTTYYRYFKFLIAFSGTYSATHVYGYSLAEVVISGITTATEVDVSTDVYLHGRIEDDILTEEIDTTEWLTWPNDKVKVAKGPGAGDSYSSIYWTDGEKLQSYGTYGQRDVWTDRPLDQLTGALLDRYAESFEGRLRVEGSAGTTTVAMPIKQTWVTDVGYILTFTLPETIVATTTVPTEVVYEFDIEGAPSWIGEAEIGTKYPQTDGAVTFASVEITQINGNVVPSSFTATDYTWEEREVILTVNMNYRLQTNATYFYVMTYVNDLGDESEPSPISSIITRNAQERLTLTLPVSTDPYIKKKRIYRSNNSSDLTTGFFFVDEVDNDTATYIDWSRDEDNVEGLIFHTNPPDFLEGIVMMPGGFALAFKGKNLYASEPYRIYSWPPEYDLPFDSDIIGLSVSGNECYVLTNDKPYLVTGNSPDSLFPSRIPYNQSCSSYRGIAIIGHTTYFISPDGLVSLYGSEANLLSDEYIQPRDWDAYNPSTFMCDKYNDKLYACSDNTFFVMDFKKGLKAITTLQDLIQGIFYDSIDDVLYCIVADEILSIDTDASNHNSLIWKTKEFKFAKPIGFSAIRVQAESYDDTDGAMEVELYANGSLAQTVEIVNDKARRIQIPRKEKTWSFKITSQHEIRDIVIAQSIQELNE